MEVHRAGQRRFRVVFGATSIDLEVVRSEDGALEVIRDGVRRRVRYALEGTRVWIDDGVRVRVHRNTTHEPARRAEDATGRITAPHDGAVTKLMVAAGDRVERGQLVVVLEAMKMEQQIKAGIDGTVGAIHVKAGAQVRTGQLLVELEEK